MKTTLNLSQTDTVTATLTTKPVALPLVFGLLLIGFLTACSNSKTTPAVTNQSSNTFVIGTDKLLAQCGRSSDSNFTFNTSIAHDQNGVIAPDWIKIKFSFLSTAATASGNTIRFFKWRVAGTTTDLDQTPLTFYTYNTSSTQTTSSPINALSASQINQTVGVLIQLNDASGIYQVIKAVVYNSDGTMVAQINTLIPAFYAKPSDYQSNSDGTARAPILQQMHPLANTDVTNWSDDQFTQTFNALCI